MVGQTATGNKNHKFTGNKMIQIGEYVIVLGPRFQLFLISLAGSVLASVIGYILYTFRSRPRRMALRQFRVDYPDSQAVEINVMRLGIKTFCEIVCRDGKIYKYEISQTDEVATLIQGKLS